MEAIRNFRKPITKKDLRSFLGTTSYYRRFIPKYADHSVFLTEATRKTALYQVNWTNKMKSDFEYLCSSLSKSCILTIALPDDDFLLQTDASGKGFLVYVGTQQNYLWHSFLVN